MNNTKFYQQCVLSLPGSLAESQCKVDLNLKTFKNMFIFVFLTCFILSCASAQVSDCEGNDSIEKGIDNIYFRKNKLKGINITF